MRARDAALFALARIGSIACLDRSIKSRSGSKPQMENDMNRITVHGNIVRAEIKTAENGTRYFRATVASDRSTKGDSATDFFPVVAFGDWIDDLADLAKGDFCKVVGTVRLGEHDGKRTVEIVAKQIERPVKESAA